MKSLKLLHTKETIYWTKGQSLLTSLDTRTNLPFYGMIARTKCYVFTMIFPAVLPLEPTFWPAQYLFWIYGYCREYFLWKQHKNDVTFSFGYYYTITFSLFRFHFLPVKLFCSFHLYIWQLSTLLWISVIYIYIYIVIYS